MCILFTFLNLTTFQNFKVKPVNLTLLYCAKMLRLTVHLILLISFYFALFDGIEANIIYDVNNIGWDPLDRCEIELIEPSGRTTRFE